MRLAIAAAAVALLGLLAGSANAGDCRFTSNAATYGGFVQNNAYCDAGVQGGYGFRVRSQSHYVDLNALRAAQAKRDAALAAALARQAKRDAFAAQNVYGGGFRQNGFGGGFRQQGGGGGGFRRLLGLAATGAGAFGGASVGGPVGAIFGGIAGQAVGEAISGQR